jgi:hypothetical protein
MASLKGDRQPSTCASAGRLSDGQRERERGQRGREDSDGGRTAREGGQRGRENREGGRRLIQLITFITFNVCNCWKVIRWTERERKAREGGGLYNLLHSLLSFIYFNVSGVSKKFGEWYQKAKKQKIQTK